MLVPPEEVLPQRVIVKWSIRMESGDINPYLFIFTPDRGKINKGEFNSSLMNSSCFLFCNPNDSFGKPYRTGLLSALFKAMLIRRCV